MRIWFFEEEVAREAAGIWKRHGYSATRRGATVTTNCPTFWAVSVIDREIGFDKVMRMEVVPSAEPRASADVVAVGGSALAGEPLDLASRRVVG
jgi:hypothetical protein